MNPASALAAACPNTIVGSALAGINCDFNSGSSITVANGGSVGGISMNAYFPTSSFILNNGTISDASGSDGLLINSSTLSNGITNAGQITMINGNGISIRNSSTISGGLTNSGTIESGNESILIDNSTINGDITNSGSISSSGVFVGLALLNNSTVSGGLHNTGTIQATGNGAGIIIRSNSSIASGITNSGTISSTGHDGLVILNSSTINGGITNETGGIISGGLAGVSVHNASIINGSILNQSGATISSGDTGIQVYSNTTISGSIQNSGNISGSNTGISVLSSATIAGGISNAGTIQGGIYAINIDAGSHVNNIDLFTGSRVIGAINAVSSDVNIIGDFTTEGTMNVNALNISSGSVFNMGNTITAANSVSNAGTLAIGTNTQTIVGDYVQDSGGILKMGVQNTTTYGQLAVTGTADFSQSGAINVDVANNANIAQGDVYSNAISSGVLVAPVSGFTVTDNSYVWNFQLVGNDIHALQLSGSSLGFNHADTSTYNALQSLAGASTSNPAMLQILGNLNSASNKEGAQNVLESVEPTLNGSDLIGAQTLNNQTLDMAGQQLEMLRSLNIDITNLDNLAPAAGGDMKPKGYRAWGRLFGVHETQYARGGISGYGANTWGGVLGIDTQKINDKSVLGVAFSYGSTDANSSNSNHTDTDSDSYQLTLYGNYTLEKDTFVDGMLAYGWQNVDTTRYGVGGTPGVTARGSFDTSQYIARAELGKNFAYASAIVTPSFIANYLHYSPDSYTESGAGGANLYVDRKDMDILEIGPRVTVSRAYQMEGGVLTPSAHSGLRYDVIGDHLDATNIFAAGGPAFDTQGIRPGHATFDMGARLNYQMTGSWEFTANYDFQYKPDYISNAGFLHATYKF